MGLVKNVLYKFSGVLTLKKFRKQSIFPYYHVVSDDKIPHLRHLYHYKNKEHFLNDIELLTKNFSPLNPKELLVNNIKNNTFLLTFDDGLKEVYTEIYPVLKKNQLNAIFFINPAYIDNTEGFYKHYISIVINELEKRSFKKSDLDFIADLFQFHYNSVHEFKAKFLKINRQQENIIHEVFSALGIDIKNYLNTNKPYLTKSQIKEMIDDGFYFGAHTMTHPYLDKLSHEEQYNEITESINWLKSNFNLDYSFFAFPFTDKNVSKLLITDLFNYDKELRIFGNSGLKKDVDERIIQRFSLENPEKDTKKTIITENLYKIYNQLIGSYKIKRK